MINTGDVVFSTHKMAACAHAGPHVLASAPSNSNNSMAQIDTSTVTCRPKNISVWKMMQKLICTSGLEGQSNLPLVKGHFYEENVSLNQNFARDTAAKVQGTRANGPFRVKSPKSPNSPKKLRKRHKELSRLNSRALKTKINNKSACFGQNLKKKKIGSRTHHT